MGTPLSTLIRRVGRTSWFPRAFGWLVPVDTAVHRLSRGRFGLTALGGVDSLLLTATGARSGQPRTVALTCAPIERDFLVAGSNWGGARHPGWSANLLAHPEAEVTVRGRTFPVRARLLTGADRESAWAVLAAHWPPYDTYAARADREIRVFRLQRRGAPSGVDEAPR
jgi:deazaflavin-dependent oxidoreductase (nitroreductase family)